MPLIQSVWAASRGGAVGSQVECGCRTEGRWECLCSAAWYPWSATPHSAWSPGPYSLAHTHPSTQRPPFASIPTALASSPATQPVCRPLIKHTMTFAPLSNFSCPFPFLGVFFPPPRPREMIHIGSSPNTLFPAVFPASS